MQRTGNPATEKLLNASGDDTDGLAQLGVPSTTPPAAPPRFIRPVVNLGNIIAPIQPKEINPASVVLGDVIAKTQPNTNQSEVAPEVKMGKHKLIRLKEATTFGGKKIGKGAILYGQEVLDSNGKVTAYKFKNLRMKGNTKVNFCGADGVYYAEGLTNEFTVGIDQVDNKWYYNKYLIGSIVLSAAVLSYMKFYKK